MCNNPEAPFIDLNQVPSSAPIRCANCGGELQLVCVPNACDAPLGERNQVRGRGISRSGRRTFREKPCMRCLRTFQPSGPRSIYCSRGDCEERAQELAPVPAVVEDAIDMTKATTRGWPGAG